MSSKQKKEMTDAEFEALEKTVLATIQELVMALHHVGDGEYDQAQDCLVTSGLNVQQMEETNLRFTEEGK